MIHGVVKGGTGAKRKRSPHTDVRHCVECGGFVSCPRAARGETLCLRCKDEEAYAYELKGFGAHRRDALVRLTRLSEDVEGGYH